MKKIISEQPLKFYNLVNTNTDAIVKRRVLLTDKEVNAKNNGYATNGICFRYRPIN